MTSFRVGQLIIYKMDMHFQIGKIKRICDDGQSAFVWYNLAETAAKTNVRDMTPIINDHCITRTILGGEDAKND